MSVNSTTRLFVLIGHPIKHSLSPVMHNAVFNGLGINAVYLCFDVKPEHLDKIIQGIRWLSNISGFNVTVPYKEKILHLLDRVYDTHGLVKSIGAVNTVKHSGDKLLGYNTDSIGFIEALKKLGFNPFNKKAFIVGAGGVGKALAVALASKKISYLQIYDIDYKRAAALRNRIKKNFDCPVSILKDINKLDVKNVDLLLNATPIGMHKNDPLPLPSYLLKRNLFVYDVVYNPEGRKTTLLVETARKKGLYAYDGIGMLVYQGIKALQIWFGNKIKTDAASSIIFKAFKKEGISPS